MTCQTSFFLKTKAVTDIIKFLPYKTVQKILACVDIRKLQRHQDMIELKYYVKEENEDLEYFEDVSDINGKAIPDLYANTANNVDTSVQIEIEQYQIEQNLRRIIYINEKKTRNKITNFDWLTVDKVNECMRRLKNQNISLNFRNFEQKIEREVIYKPEKKMPIKLSGRLDCVERKNIWEFKCVRTLTDEHKLQLALYMYMKEENMREEKKKTKNKKVSIKEIIKPNQLEKKFNPKEKDEKNVNKKKKISKSRIKKENQNLKKKKIRKSKTKNIKYFRPNERRYYLYNILSDEKLEIKSDINRLRKIVRILFKAKYGEKEASSQSDNTFVEETLQLKR